MKKLLLKGKKARGFLVSILVFMTAVMVLSGCVSGASSGVSAAPAPDQVSSVSAAESPEATPEVTAPSEPTPVVWATEPPASADDKKTGLLNAILARVQENIDTGTFEGFTQQSTFQDVAECGMELSFATDIFAVDFLSFPANICYSYSPAQKSLTYHIMPDERTDYEDKLADVLNKLDDELGDHTKDKRSDGWVIYTWMEDEAPVRIQTKADEFEQTGTLGMLILGNAGKDISPVNIPGIFYVIFGVDFDAAYEDRMLTLLNSKENAGYGITQTYIADDISIRFYFKRDKTNNSIMFTLGDYNFNANTRDADSSAEYIETCLASFQDILGEPQSCEYSTPEGNTAETAEAIKQMNSDDIRLKADWPGISLEPYHYKGQGVNFWLIFRDSFFSNADWYKD